MLKQENIPSFRLNDQTVIPMLGTGTRGLAEEKIFPVVEKALAIGYRHIDVGGDQENRAEIGKALIESGILREDIFLSLKIQREDLWDVKSMLDESCEKLKTNYIDLFILPHSVEDIQTDEILKTLSDLKASGNVKAIGVSGFSLGELSRVLAAGHNIIINQVEYHPSLSEKELQDFCESKNILITAYSPFGYGYDLEIGVIKEMAEKYGASPAQVILSWHLQERRIVIPKADSEKQLKENFESLNIKLEKEDLEKIDAIG